MVAKYPEYKQVNISESGRGVSAQTGKIMRFLNKVGNRAW